MNTKRPNLNSYSLTNAEMFIAADITINHFLKANIMSSVAYEQKFLSFQSMNYQTRNKKTDEFIDLIESTMKDRIEEWGKYQCNVHFRNEEKGQSVLVDAGIFTLKIYLDKRGKYRLKYSEIN